jgi:hypothetical protein
MTFNLKPEVDIRDLQMIHPALFYILADVFAYCAKYELPCTITSIMSGREGVKESSKTHSEGRAFDLSVREWPEIHIHRIEKFINKRHTLIAAVSSSDSRPRAAVYHDVGHGAHIHFQVKRGNDFFASIE